MNTMYKVINAPHLRTLEALVNLAMCDGWEPQGGVYAVAREKPKPAMIFYVNEDGSLAEAAKEESLSRHKWHQAVVRKKNNQH